MFDSKCLELAEHFLGVGHPGAEELAQRFQDVAEEPKTVRCDHCTNGRFLAECCNGSSGCSCGGQEVDMGLCRVCYGTGWRTADADTTANIRAIGNRCYLGSGPRYADAFPNSGAPL